MSKFDFDTQELLRRGVEALEKIASILSTPLEPVAAELEETGDADAYFRCSLIGFKTYDISVMPIVVRDMEPWLVAHGKNTNDVIWERINSTYGCKISNIVLSQSEINRLMIHDKQILNICGHPWYFGSEFKLVGYKGGAHVNSD